MSKKTIILIVDDEPDTLGLVESILTGHGYDVVTASDGRTALALLRDGLAPCLILIDLEMPFMSGARLREELADEASTKDLPVIMTSASRENLDRLQREISRLEKPFTLRDLIRAVEEHCSPVSKGRE